MTVGDAQRKRAIVTNNLDKPFIFICFGEDKEPIMIADKVSLAMSEKTYEQIKEFHLDMMSQLTLKKVELQRGGEPK